MKNLFSLFQALVIAYFSGLLVSCAPEACFEETNAFLKSSFYSNTTKDPLAPDSLTLIGLEQTEEIYHKAAGVKLAMLPLNASTGNCTFLIRINGVNDTIRFVYSSFPHLISKECGYTFYHTLDTFFYSNNIIDYVFRSSNNITTLNEENIRIFY
jgi:hypothetical protein